MPELMYTFKAAGSDIVGAMLHKDALGPAFARHIDAHDGQVRLTRQPAEGGPPHVGPWRLHPFAKLHFPRRVENAGKNGDLFYMDWRRYEGKGIRTFIRVHEAPSRADLGIAWCEARLGTPYLLGGETDRAFDCSWMSRKYVETATGGKLILPHRAAEQEAMTDVIIPIQLAKAVRGDLMFFHQGAHVAVLHHWTPDGHYFVIDQEPHAEDGIKGDFIAGGLRIRPGYFGYYVGPQDLDHAARIVAINGPV